MRPRCPSWTGQTRPRPCGHALRAAGRVIQRRSALRIEDADHQLNDPAGRVELAGLLARRIGELRDQVFVRCAQQIREFEIFIQQAVFVEWLMRRRSRSSGISDSPIFLAKLMWPRTPLSA